MKHHVVKEAALFAAEKHGGQKRKFSEDPYIFHPGRVAMRMTLLGASDDEIAAAWLHDVVEDCDVSIADIESVFGSYVARLVDGMTNRYKKSSFPDLNRAERKRREKVRIQSETLAVKRIKLVDRIDNLREVDPQDEFTEVYVAESNDLLEVLRGTDQSLEDEFDSVLSNLIRRMP